MSVWAQQKERSSKFWLRLIVSLYRIFGRTSGELLLYPVALFYFLLSPGVRGVSSDFLAHLRRAEGCSEPSYIERQIFAFRHILAFARCLLDKFAVWQGDIGRNFIRFDGRDELRARLKSGQGVVILGAHLGNSEILRAIADEVPYTRINALMFTTHNPAFNEILGQSQRDPWVRMLPIESVGPETILMLRDCVERGEAVALLADRVTPGAPEKRVSAKFLDAMAEFPAGPFLLASLLECPVYLSFCLRKSARAYDVRMEHFAERLVFPRATRQAALQREVERFASRLSQIVLAYPTEWFNFFPFWGTAQKMGTDSPRAAESGELVGRAVDKS